MQSGTNLPRVRDYNQGVVLEAIRICDGVSRVEIAEQTGLTAQTVSNIVRRLLDEGLVIEDGLDPSGRKPRVRLRINPTGPYAIGVLLDRDETSLVMMGLDGQIVACTRYSVDQQQGASTIIDQISSAIEQLIQKAAIPREKILGIGLGCPGAMNHTLGIVYEPLDLFGWNWHEVALRDALKDKTGYPVVVDNDATASAIGERWVGGAQRAGNFAFIFMGMGIGAGFFIGNQLYRGDTTNAGEFGHMTLNIDGPLCFCGNRGCLELYCAPAHIVTAVKEQLKQGKASLLQSSHLAELGIEAIYQAALAGDEIALSEIQRSATYLAAGVVSLVNLLDLPTIILGGQKLYQVGAIYKASVERALRERLITRNVRHVGVELSIAGENAGAVGAAALVLHELYSPRLTELRLTAPLI